MYVSPDMNTENEVHVPSSKLKFDEAKKKMSDRANAALEQL